MSEEWKLVAEFQRPISRLQLSVISDAEIEIRDRYQGVVNRYFLSANVNWQTTCEFPRSGFSVWLRSRDPNCQCQIHAEYIDEVTTLPSVLDMRYLYGLMGLGIPMPVSGLPLDVSSFYVNRSPYADISGPLRPQPYPIDTIGKETAKQDKPQTPSPGITRLQAFKRELEETETKKKSGLLSRLKRKRGEEKK